MLVDITLPKEGEGAESVLERWLRQPGEPVRLHEPLLEINTDKAVVEVPSPATGVLREILKQPNEPIAPGDILGRIEVVRQGESVSTTPQSSPPVAMPASTGSARETDLSPAVRQLVKKHNVDVTQLSGTGRGGRITHEDVQHYLKQRAGGSGEARPAGA